MTSKGIHFASSPDVFLEIWLRRSSDESAIAAVPTLFHYAKNMNGGRQGQRGVSVELAFYDPSKDGTSQSASTTSVVVGDYKPKSDAANLYRFEIKSASDGNKISQSIVSSPWISSPFIKSASNGSVGPKNVEIKFQELRAGIPILAFIGEVLTQTRPEIKEQLEIALLKEKREEARQSAAKAKAVLLESFAMAVSEATAAQTAYCEANADTYLEQSTKFHTKQLLANAAADAVDISQPYPILVAISSDSPDGKFCS